MADDTAGTLRIVNLVFNQMVSSFIIMNFLHERVAC